MRHFCLRTSLRTATARGVALFWPVVLGDIRFFFIHLQLVKGPRDPFYFFFPLLWVIHETNNRVFRSAGRWQHESGTVNHFPLSHSWTCGT